MSIYDAAKRVLEKAPADNIDLRRAAMDVMDLALKSDEELSKMRQLVSTLEQAMSVDKALTLKNGVYWMPVADGKMEGPYCPACWGTEHNLVPMLLKETAQLGTFWATCSIHDTGVNFTTMIPPE
jgi:hypothetical protein